MAKKTDSLESHMKIVLARQSQPAPTPRSYFYVTPTSPDAVLNEHRVNYSIRESCYMGVDELRKRAGIEDNSN